jgi:hypothetical protein
MTVRNLALRALGPTTRRGALALVAAVGLSAAGASSAIASSIRHASAHKASLTNITVVNSASGTPDPVFAQVFLAQTLGYFKKVGINMIADEPGGTLVPTVVVANTGDIGWAGAAIPLDLTNENEQMIDLYAPVGGGLAAWMTSTSKSITSPSQCTTVVTSAPPATTYAWALVEKSLFKANWTFTTAATQAILENEAASGQYSCAVGAVTVLDPAVFAGQEHWIFQPDIKKQRPPGWPATTDETTVFASPATLAMYGPTTMTHFMEAVISAGDAEKNMTDLQIAKSILKYTPSTTIETAPVMASVLSYAKGFNDPGKGFISPTTWSNGLTFFADGGNTFINPASPTWSYANNVNMTYYNAALKALKKHPLYVPPKPTKKKK